MFSANVFIAYSNDPIARGCQELRTCVVMGLVSVSVVRTPLELEDEAFASTVKVHDEAVQNVLPAKLQAEYAPIAQQRPRMTLGGRGPMAQRASELESLRWSEAAKRIHRARMPSRPHVETTRIPRRETKTRGATNFHCVPPLPKGAGDRG